MKIMFNYYNAHFFLTMTSISTNRVSHLADLTMRIWCGKTANFGSRLWFTYASFIKCSGNKSCFVFAIELMPRF